MKDFKTFISELKEKLDNNALPGERAQLRMSPVTRKMILEESKSTGGKRKRVSAVLILFYPKNDVPHLTFIKRAPDNTVHSGQISFPGGKVEESDNTLEDTALREANEEVGVIPSNVKIIGQLTKLYIPPSNFDVYPTIGYSDDRPDFITNEEVDKLLEVNLSDLLDPDNKSYNKITHRDGNEFVVPSYSVQGEVIWGATGMMLGELLEVVGDTSAL